jgi:pimeloyl-ACP methyl ester carboxylesterase
MAPTTQYDDSPRHRGLLQPTRQRRIGVIVIMSLASGLVAALILTAAPFIPAKANILTGGVLLGFAFGWALLAVLSVRFSNQPQRWAAAPALFFTLAGVISLIGSEAVNSVWGWIWPPILLALVVWIVIRARQHLRSRTRRWLLYPLLAVLALASVGGGYQTVRDATANPMPGQLIDVGGHRLHLYCTGARGPTVVLEPGLGGASLDMTWIAAAVARDSRVCVYDRAGRGWSDAADGPQDAAQTTTDLHTLLDRAHIPGPYVLAGHSFGGLYVLSFAAQYPDQVAGMVLLDSTAPVAAQTPPATTGSYSFFGRVSALLPGAVGSFINEFRQGSVAMQQAASLADFANKPLIVITAGRGHDAEWMLAQESLATLSTNSRHRVVADATHQSLVLDETDVAAGSQAIRDVVTAVRTSRPLPSP